MTRPQKVLLTGAGGQIGIELSTRLRELFGTDAVLATDVRHSDALLAQGPFELLDVTDKEQLSALFDREKPTVVYHLASLLSATSEQKPELAWKVNIQGLLNVLDACVPIEGVRLFWPSSIAVFGPNTPGIMTPQDTIMDPDTVYGIGKLAGERWCSWYHRKYGLDVRSLRYPGLISYKAMPGGGTTDYAVDIFFQAVKSGRYESYLRPDTMLPMMYMDDAIRGTLMLMQEPSEQISVRSSYNIAAVSFSVEALAAAIKSEIPEFEISYKPDFRQEIADSWPSSIDDSSARSDWNWAHQLELGDIVEQMLNAVKAKVTV